MGDDIGSDADAKASTLLNDLGEISFGWIALIVLGTWATIVALRIVLPFLAERGPSPLRLYLLGAVPIARLLLITVAVLLLIPEVFNVTFQNFLVIAGAASVAIGFAFKDLVTSVVAGVVAVFERPYRPGDWVRVGDDYGEVRSVGLRSFRMVTAEDNAIIVPHSQIWDDNVANANDGTRTCMVVATFRVDPDHDGAAVRAALHDVAATSAYLHFDRPVAVMAKPDVTGTSYMVKAYPFDLREQFRFKTDLTLRGKAALRDLGVAEVVGVEGMA
ncbi:mechanosensitive ion channel family protein [Jannaschia sp. LMIT008]|uniref:mechanosensitive ion channel family protein n=1 Tax=Jannaschia maritima TaxID=3032585 RepID=UPI0028110A9B|nr:mechanosensitive ion channel domain-containing protein [Jannaschia sp. LMIT008]